MNYLAAIKKSEGPIPDLRPAKGHITFDVPESAILNGALIFAFAVLIIGRVIQSRRPLPPRQVEPPIVLARRALESACGPTIVADCEQIVRRYLFKAFGIGPEGATASELCAAFAAHPSVSADSLAALRGYLAGNELARFAPHDAPDITTACVEQALELVGQLEARRICAEPPPLPVAT